MLHFELKADLNGGYLRPPLAGRRAQRVRSLAELIAFNERNAAREMPLLCAGAVRRGTEAKGPLDRRRVSKRRWGGRTGGSRASRASTRRSPSTERWSRRPAGQRGSTDYVNGDHSQRPAASQPAAVAGYPHITVPAGFAFGLPVGVSFFASALQRAHARAPRVRLRAGDEGAPAAAGPATAPSARDQPTCRPRARPAPTDFALRD